MLLKNITVVDQDYKVKTGMNVLIRDKIIQYVGKDLPINDPGEILDGKNKIAMPGFFNAHSHIPMTLIRGYGEGLPLHNWLTERMFPFEALLTGEDMYWGALLGAAEMISSGAVSFSDMYMQLESIAKAVDESGMKANLSYGATAAFQPEMQFKDTNGWDETHNLLSYIKGLDHDRIVADAGIHAEYTSNETLLRTVSEFAQANNMNIQVHLSETAKEQQECKARRDGRTPTEWLEYCNVLEAPVIAAHCVWLEGQDFDILAEKDVTVAHCPSSNLKLGSGIAPLKTMLDKGIKVAIGTDGAASNNNLNMLEEVNLASILQKGATQDPTFLQTDEVLELACKNGALAQSRQDCGAIKSGNRADIVVYDMDKPHLTPVHDPLSNILYSAQSADVYMTIVDGKVLYKNGEFKTIDIEKVMYQAEKIKQEKVDILQKR